MIKNKFTPYILLTTVLFLLLSCGSQQDQLPGANIEKISNPDKNLTIDDITAVGFKKNKTYKVNDLPEAKSAYYGFLKIPKEKTIISYTGSLYKDRPINEIIEVAKMFSEIHFFIVSTMFAQILKTYCK